MAHEVIATYRRVWLDLIPKIGFLALLGTPLLLPAEAPTVPTEATATLTTIVDLAPLFLLVLMIGTVSTMLRI